MFIAGMGYHHPQRRVTNEDLVRRMDTSDEWIRERTGIRERRYADDGVDTSDLGVLATTKALDDVGWDPAEIELLICATSTPDCLVPSTASYICNKLQLPSVALDVNAACSGFVYGLAVARGLMETSGFGRVALCTAEKYSRVVDPTDRRNAIFWGDSAATVMLQRDPPPVGAELVDVVLKNVNEGADLAKVPIRGYVAVEGNAVKPIADKGFMDSATDILERNRLSTADLRAFMGHQVNLRVLESLADTLGALAQRGDARQSGRRRGRHDVLCRGRAPRRRTRGRRPLPAHRVRCWVHKRKCASALGRSP
jgi:3-oxoacyl-[acyl-carrier-protein] synthase-3